ncbi:MAG: ankyrin repeat domain-containing protein [Akkermansia sp.]|nr:ankyrin repeat domain-containing protein [Akkermansia sp.]
MNKQTLHLNEALLAACENGNARAVRRLLKKGAHARALRLSTYCGYDSALSLAARADSTECVRLLLEAGANVHDCNKELFFKPLPRACINGNYEMTKLLLDAGADACEVDMPEGLSVIHCAARGDGDVAEIVDMLVAHGANVNECEYEHTPFARACLYGNVKISKRLLAYGAAPLLDGMALQYACASGSPELVKIVMDAGARPEDYCDYPDDNPLIYAAFWTGKFNPEVAQMMYDRGCRFVGLAEHIWLHEGDFKKYGSTYKAEAMQWLRDHGAFEPGVVWDKRYEVRDFSDVVHAAEHGMDELETLLEREGLDLKDQTRYSTDALYQACAQGNEKAIRTLVAAGADASADSKVHMRNVFMAGYGDEPSVPVSCLEFLCSHGADPDYHDDDGYSPLIRAIDDDDLERVKFFLGKGVNMEARYLGAFESKGGTPYLIACSSGSLEIVQTLAAAGCNRYAVLPNGATDLMLAVAGNYLELAEWLIDTGAHIHARDHAGKSVLMYAKTSAMVNFLMDRGARADVVAKDGTTAVHTCCRINSLPRLLHEGCPADNVTADGRHSLDLPYRYSSCADCVELLLRQGANPNYVNGSGTFPLFESALYGHADNVRILLDSHACPHLCTRTELQTPLHAVCTDFGNHAQDAEILRRLLREDADPNERDYMNRTPLMLLCKSAKATVRQVRSLLSHGADPALEDVFGNTAQDFAAEANHPAIVKLLQDAAELHQTRIDE